MNRLHKVMQDTRIKLDCVATDMMGKSGRAMLDALVSGTTDPVVLADLARGQLRKKLPALETRSRVVSTSSTRWSSGGSWRTSTTSTTRSTSSRARSRSSSPPRAGGRAFVHDPRRRVPRRRGDHRRDRRRHERFPTAKHLASWAGMCPGNDESAGKRRSGKTRKGSKWLSGAGRGRQERQPHQNTYLAAQYARLRARRGANKATIAVGHSIQAAAWHMLQTGETYTDPGGDFFARRDPERTRNASSASSNGSDTVTLEPATSTATNGVAT